MCEEQLDREKGFDRQVVFSCPTCCFEGYDRWRQAFCTPLCRSQEGFRIIAKLMFPFTRSLCTASVLQRGANHPLWQRQINTPTSWEVHVNTATPCPLQFTAENKGWGVHKNGSLFNWHPSVLQSRPTMQFAPHALAPFFANNYLLYWGCLCVCV